MCLVCGADWLLKHWDTGEGLRSFLRKVMCRVRQALKKEYAKIALIEASFDDVKLSPWRDFSLSWT